jgi:hypothetical protein
MNLLRVFDRYWLLPVPAARLALLRILIGAYALIYLLVRFQNLRSVARFDRADFRPVGLATLLTEPLPAIVVTAVTLLALALALPFVLGFRYRIFGPLFAIAFLWVTTYRNSFGMVFHTENLLALQLLLVGLAPAADAFAVDAVELATPEPDGRYGWAIRAMTWVTVIAYVLAGVAKLKLAGLAWLDGELLRRHIAHDNLRKLELGSFHAPLGAALVRYAAPFQLFSVLTVLIELGAPLALLGRRFALAWCLAAWSFHVGVLALMAIPFPYQLSLIAYAPFFELERWRELLTRLRRGYSAG